MSHPNNYPTGGFPPIYLCNEPLHRGPLARNKITNKLASYEGLQRKQVHRARTVKKKINILLKLRHRDC